MIKIRKFTSVLSKTVSPPGEAEIGVPHTAAIVLPESGAVYAFASTLDLAPDPPLAPSQQLPGAWTGNFTPVVDSLRGLMVPHPPPPLAPLPMGASDELDSLTGQERVQALGALASLSWRQAMDQLLSRQASTSTGHPHSRAATPRAPKTKSSVTRGGEREKERERDRTPTGRPRSGTQTSNPLLSEGLPRRLHEAELRSRALNRGPSPTPPNSAPPAQSGFAGRDPSPVPSKDEDEDGPILHPGMVVPSSREGVSSTSLFGGTEKPAGEDQPDRIVPLLNTCEMGAVLTLPLVGKTKPPSPPPPNHGAQTPGSVSNSHHSLTSGTGTPLSGLESGSVPHPVFLLVLNCDLPVPAAEEEVPSMEDVPGSAPSREDAEDQEVQMWKELNARANRVAEKLFGPVSALAASPIFANPTPALLHPRPPTTAGSQT